VIPRSLHRLIARLRAQFANTRVDRDFDRELATHLALLEEDFLRSGMSPEQAHREARRACGGVEQTRQLHREARRLPWLSRFLQDIRYAARISRKHFGFTTTVVATLGLGIGFSTAIFTVIWATLLAALPYPHAEQLVMIWGRGHNEISVGDYLDWKTASRSFQDIDAWSGGPVTFSPAASSALPKTMQSRRVPSGYFRMQGVAFALGREFLPQETQPNNSRFVVLVNKTWQQLGADPNILGKPLRIDGQPYIVVGVLAPGLEDRGMGDIVIPLAITPEDRNHDRRWLTVMGRLRPGVSLAQAQSELSAISSHVAAANADTTTNAEPAALVEPLKNDFIPPNRILMLWLLLGAVGFLLLIACVNAANLLLARAAVRRQEMAVRGAMGASPRRLFAQCITESLVLALLGGAAGVAVAYAGLRALVAILPPNTLPSEAELTLSLPVLGFTLAITTLIGIVFGATPALSASHAEPADALRGGGRSSAGIAHSQLRRSLVITEFALALTLLACVRQRLHRIDGRRSRRGNGSRHQSATSSPESFRHEQHSLPEVFELHIHDRILFPILIVEVPPLFRDDLETLFFHGLAQDGTALALVGSAASVIGIGAIGHFIVAAGHRHFLTRFQIVKGQIYSATPVMLGACCRISNKNPFILGHGLPEDFRDVPRAVAIMNHQSVSLSFKFTLSAKQCFRRRPLKECSRLGIYGCSEKIVRGGVADVELDRGIKLYQFHQIGLKKSTLFLWWLFPDCLCA
jgi:hypothetical protein